MNIHPSDTDVRQGLNPATGAVSQGAGKSDPAAKDLAKTQPQAGAVDADSRRIAAAADKTEAQDAARKISEKLEASGSKIKIRLLEDSSNEVQVEIVDSSSNKVLRKIPQDEILKLSASIKKMSGLALDQPA